MEKEHKRMQDKLKLIKQALSEIKDSTAKRLEVEKGELLEEIDQVRKRETRCELEKKIVAEEKNQQKKECKKLKETVKTSQ